MDSQNHTLTGISFPSTSRYVLLDEIGRGGMGVVFLAKRISEGVVDLVVLKTIRTLSKERLQMLIKEANIAAALRHENIVRSYGLESIPLDALPKNFMEYEFNSSPHYTFSSTMSTVGMDILEKLRHGNIEEIEERTPTYLSIESDKSSFSDNKLYLMVMDYIEGYDLKTFANLHIEKGLLIPIELGAFIISRMCRALSYAHQFIIHRDISPENILINNQGVAKLTDFGIAVGIESVKEEIAGKFQYMSPEQIYGKRVDNRSDIFSLGIVAYEIATGVNPLVCGIDNKIDEFINIREKIKEKIPSPLEICKDIPEVYANIISKMIELSPEERFQSITDVGTQIEKEFIYAKGFGPTNNSLESYLKIFMDDFQKATSEDIEQLSFLIPDGDIKKLKRKISPSIYTEKGKEIIKNNYPNLMELILKG